MISHPFQYLPIPFAIAAGCVLTFGFALPNSVADEVKPDPASARAPISFRDDVRPILSNHCFACHGPDEEHNEAGVRLDIADEVDLDEVIARITSADPDLVMPPPHLNKPLNNKQVQILTHWIKGGAPYEKHWAFVPPRKVPLPEIDGTTWEQEPLDRFVLASLRAKGLQPSPSADKRTLVRRLHLDLTGLPPTRDEIHDFLADESPDAYGNLVSRLLNRPAYGEHMARYWLDLVRFADTNGLHHDHYREMTPYRDWVIRAFNQNMPMDQFFTDQLAGDLYENPTSDQLIASGFNRLHLIIDRGTALPEESAFRNVVDRVSSVGTALMGLTMQCAVCHDHKYDPITQKDFYQLSAFFNNFDGEPETGRRGTIDFKRGLQAPFLELPTAEQSTQRAVFDKDLDNVRAEIRKLNNRLAATKKEAAKLKAGASTQDASTDKLLSDVQRKLNQQTSASLNEAIKRLTTLEDQISKRRDMLLLQIPATLIMKERTDVRPTHIMVRGAYDQPGEEVFRDTPGFLPPMQSSGQTKTRMDLANWFTDSEHPLTARVAVNRFWQQLFGVGLVRTSEDFGSQGETPSHPELLDFLAINFVESGWDVKELMRKIVMSKTYQQSSVAEQQDFTNDPQNRLLARGSRYRLDAEVVRDQMLCVSGMLNDELYGKSVKPPQPAGLWKLVAMPTSFPSQFQADTGDAIHRRSVYTFWKRGLPPPQMTVFDAPTRESCIARRERTNTPLQALLLMNEEQHFAAAKHFASNLLTMHNASDDQRIEIAYETITAHLPSENEAKLLRESLYQFRDLYRSKLELTDQLVSDTAKRSTDERIEQAAWTMLVHSLLNLSATKTRE